MKAIKGRASTRAFLEKPVSHETVRTILNAARWAPSGANTQPWQVAVVTGDVKQRIGDAVVAAVNQGQKPNPDYHYYANRIPEPYRSRQIACGKALYGALGIERNDKERRKEQWLKNYHGFGAPLELFVFLEDFLEKGSRVDAFTKWFGWKT